MNSHHYKAIAEPYTMFYDAVTDRLALAAFGSDALDTG